MNKIFHASKSEKFVVAKLYDFILMMVVLILFGGIIFALPFVNTLLHFESIVTWLNGLGLGVLDALLIKFVSIILIFLVFFIVSK